MQADPKPLALTILDDETVLGRVKQGAILRVTAFGPASPGFFIFAANGTQFGSRIGNSITFYPTVPSFGFERGWVVAPLAVGNPDLEFWTYTTGQNVDLGLDVIGYFK